MKPDRELVEKLAQLARLEFSEDEIQEFIDDFGKMTGLIEKMNELDLEGIEPLLSLSTVTNNLRPDEVRKEISREQALANAPQTDGKFFIVPRVISKHDE